MEFSILLFLFFLDMDVFEGVSHVYTNDYIKQSVKLSFRRDDLKELILRNGLSVPREIRVTSEAHCRLP